MNNTNKDDGKRSLYCYFGFLGIHDVNIPGHSFYQLPLLTSIRQHLIEDEVSRFDIYYYLPNEIKNDAHRDQFPNTEFGNQHEAYADRLVARDLLDFEEILACIRNHRYDKIFLKARFRNLSTLSKKWKDAKEFEMILDCALDSGYEGSDIYILDTDLSLSAKFIKKLEEKNINRVIPSIHFPTVTTQTASTFKSITKKYIEEGKRETFEGYYYGNLNFKNYKAGHSKNPIILEALKALTPPYEGFFSSLGLPTVHLMGKVDQETLSQLPNTRTLERHQRKVIWEQMEKSWFSINVSKDLYLKEGFVPARVYEALIFGNIPISYSPNGEYEWLHPALTFKSAEDCVEIVKFLSEQSTADLLKIYEDCVENYCKHIMKFAFKPSGVSVTEND